MTAKLSCAEVRFFVTQHRARIAEHERAIQSLLAMCSHDEMRDERDYQDPRPYRRCLGCGKAML